ncbi:MAG: hypothetical protein AB1384_12125 [Actinomycetota bacterium]
MDAYEFGQAAGGIVGVVLIILLAVYLISRLTGKGKSKAGKSAVVSKARNQRPTDYPSPSKKPEKRAAPDKVNVSGNDPERTRQKWV